MNGVNMDRDAEIEANIKRTFGLTTCTVRGDSLIVRDNCNRKLYHFANKYDGIKVERTGITIVRESNKLFNGAK